MLDRACYFGDGVYDVAYGYERTIFALQEHVDRFLKSAATLGIHLGQSKGEIMALIDRMVKKVDAKSVSVYMQASRGTGLREHVYPNGQEGNFMLMIRETPMRDMKNRKKVILYPDERHNFCGIKTLNLLPNVMASQKAAEIECDEAILYRGDTITECAHSNLLLIKDGVLVSPPDNGRIVPGIAREHLVQKSKELGIETEFREIAVDELFTADEILITSSGALCQDVGWIDGREVGGRAPELLKAIRSAVVEEYNAATGARIEVDR